MLHKAWGFGTKTLKAWWPFGDDATPISAAPVTPDLRGEGSLTTTVSVPAAPQRTWQRKWRDVKRYHADLAEIYQGNQLDQDNITRCIETFFKNCHEVGDWVQEETGLAAKKYVRTAPTLRLCDAISNTAKHHTRKPTPRSPDPITATMGDPSGDESGIHADIEWTSMSSGSGKADALKLADDCITEWEHFFHQSNLDPNS